MRNWHSLQGVGDRGPNTQTNAACAGTMQAIGMAQDMLISGRAERVVVVAGDNGSGGTLLPWLGKLKMCCCTLIVEHFRLLTAFVHISGSGFRALGAATTKEAVEDAGENC